MENPFEYGAQWKKRSGRPVLGTVCSYAPEELIRAAGALPFRLALVPENLERADAHLQSYACGLARGVLEHALGGRLGFLDGAVFPHTCDTIQRLSDIWRLNAKMALHMDVVMPVKLDTDSARQYMKDVLQKAKTDLENGLGVSITDPDLRESFALFNRLRSGIRRLYAAGVSDVEMSRIVLASMVADRREMVRLGGGQGPIREVEASPIGSARKNPALRPWS